MAHLRAALTIAGSDSGGGAGIQADLRTFARLGVHGTCAITAVTAQNLAGVRALRVHDPKLVLAQIDAVLAGAGEGGFDVRAIKTGMLATAAIVNGVAERVADVALPLVIDPVMVATSGARLLDEEAVEGYRRLCRSATVVTPNLGEADAFLGRALERASLADEARRLRDRLGCAVLLKGGHLEGDPVDVFAGQSVAAWSHSRVDGINSHGTGCTLSAALAAELGEHPAEPGTGAIVESAILACVERAIAFVHSALAHGAEAGGLLAIEAADASDAVASIRRLADPDDIRPG